MAKFSWKEVGSGFKSILSRNALLIMGFYILNMYSTYFKNGFRSLLVLDEVGLAPTGLGVLVSFFLIIGLVTRTPAGNFVDRKQDKIKTILIAVAILKALSCLLYTYLNNTVGMWISFFFDGVVWSFVGVASPAVLAKSVDKRAMGSAYAIFEGGMAVITASARPLGATLFNEYGSRLPAWIAFGIQIVSVLFVIFMDGSKFAKNVSDIKEKIADKAEEKAPKATPGKKAFLGLSMVALPLALLNGAQYIMYNMESNFCADFANTMNFNYLGPATLGGTIFGILSIVVGFLCDFMNQALLIIIAFTGQAVAPCMLASATTQSMFGAGLMIYFLTRYYTMPLKILAMKKVPASDQGIVAGTILFCQDAFSIIATTLCGALIDKIGYSGTFNSLSVLGVLLLVVFIIYTIRDNKKRRLSDAAKSLV